MSRLMCRLSSSAADEPDVGGKRFIGRSYLIATMTSISTGMPAGSELMPTAERACMPIPFVNRHTRPELTLGHAAVGAPRPIAREIEQIADPFGRHIVAK